MKIDGQCHCGAIAYEAEVDPDNVAICHCTDCQSLSGSAFRTSIAVPDAAFKLIAGEPRNYIKTAESGAQRIQSFCATCGSPIYATSVGGGPKTYNVRVGTVRQRDKLVPKRQYWFRPAQGWLSDIRNFPRIDKQSP